MRCGRLTPTLPLGWSHTYLHTAYIHTQNIHAGIDVEQDVAEWGKILAEPKQIVGLFNCQVTRHSQWSRDGNAVKVR